jgi:hypothetical protein
MKAKMIEGMEEAKELYEDRGKSGRGKKGKRHGKRRGRRKGGR